jgi:urocanate hydratase
MKSSFLEQLAKGIPLDPLPPPGIINLSVPHAPIRKVPLNFSEKELAVSNALRYFPRNHYDLLRAEFTK